MTDGSGWHYSEHLLSATQVLGTTASLESVITNGAPKDAVWHSWLLAGLARADVRQRPLIKKLKRQEAWIEREADKVLADEHKADQMLGGDRNAQPAQTPDPQALAAVLADLQAQIEALEQQTKLAQLEQEAAELQSKVQSTQLTIELVSNLVYAQLDMLRMVALMSSTSP